MTREVTTRLGRARSLPGRRNPRRLDSNHSPGSCSLRDGQRHCVPEATWPGDARRRDGSLVSGRNGGGGFVSLVGVGEGRRRTSSIDNGGTTTHYPSHIGAAWPAPGWKQAGKR